MSEQAIVPVSEALAPADFDYKELDEVSRTVIQELTHGIRKRLERTAQAMIETGLDLAKVKARLAHGQWGRWLATEFDWSERTADNFIAVYTKFKDANVAKIASSALILMTRSTVPPEATAEVLERAGAGEEMTHKKVKALVQQHKAASAPAATSGSATVKPALGPAQTAPAALPQRLELPGPTAAPSGLPPRLDLGGEGALPARLELPGTSALPQRLDLGAPPPAQTALLDPEEADELEAPPAPRSTVIASAAPAPLLANAIAAGVEREQHRLLRALDLVLTAAQQELRIRLDTSDAPHYQADPETIRATAHQLVELPQVRGLVAGLLGGLREVAQEPRNLAWVIRTL
ncbi:MAG TPA: DUF3102 domain-containing protein, partial [Roseiflexaceae bacterium]|nr:DUF3102 domain-containing protein [Roseiflexaceae bacterium]